MPSGNKPLPEPMLIQIYWRQMASKGLNELKRHISVPTHVRFIAINDLAEQITQSTTYLGNKEFVFFPLFRILLFSLKGKVRNKLEIADRWSTRIPPTLTTKIRMTCMTLTFDLLTWKWYVTHHPLMGCICATYENKMSHILAVLLQGHAWMTLKI